MELLKSRNNWHCGCIALSHPWRIHLQKWFHFNIFTVLVEGLTGQPTGQETVSVKENSLKTTFKVKSIIRLQDVYQLSAVSWNYKTLFVPLTLIWNMFTVLHVGRLTFYYTFLPLLQRQTKHFTFTFLNMNVKQDCLHNVQYMLGSFTV